jgi:hypothetical protein
MAVRQVAEAAVARSKPAVPQAEELRSPAATRRPWRYILSTTPSIRVAVF